MADVSVRQLRSDEGLLWKKLRLKALADAPYAYGRTFNEESLVTDAEWIERIAGRVASADSLPLVAEIDGEPAGIASCGVDASDPGVVDIYAMWVHPNARRRGVAEAMLSFAFAWIRERGCATARLQVTVGNTSAERLYAKAGFVDTGRREPLRDGSMLETAVLSRPIEEEAE